MTKKTHKKTTAKKARRARRTISDRMTAAQELEQATRYLAHVVAELGGHLRFIRNDLHDVANFIRTNVSCQPQVVELAEAEVLVAEPHVLLQSIQESCRTLAAEIREAVSATELAIEIEEVLPDLTGEHPKVVWAAMERDCDRGWIEYGVGLQAGWLTKAGESKLAELEGLLK